MPSPSVRMATAAKPGARRRPRRACTMSCLKSGHMLSLDGPAGTRFAQLDRVIHDLWYKNAVIYCLNVETFLDSNGDGIGDFAGLTDRLPYLAGLGVTCLWLLPFYPSPNKDDGYDVEDFYGVHPRTGSFGEFVEFMNHAQQLGLRVIVDLVCNHTSDQHPWFRDARK